MALLIGFSLYVALAVVVRALFFRSADAAPGIWMQLADEACLLCAMLVSVWGVLRRRNKSLRLLGLSVHGREAAGGAAWAVSFYVVGVGLLMAFGVARIEGVAWHSSVWGPWLLFYLVVALAEEMVLRGFVLGRMLDGGMNRWVALLASSLLFALLHFFNPDFSWLAFFNILLAGVWLGLSYLYTRNLSFPIAFHWLWNWVQDPVLGYSVSGNEAGTSLFTLRFSASDFWCGGSFGFEGSMVCTLLLMAATGWVLYRKKLS